MLSKSFLNSQILHMIHMRKHKCSFVATAYHSGNIRGAKATEK